MMKAHCSIPPDLLLRQSLPSTPDPGRLGRVALAQPPANSAVADCNRLSLELNELQHPLPAEVVPQTLLPLRPISLDSPSQQCLCNPCSAGAIKPAHGHIYGTGCIRFCLTLTFPCPDLPSPAGFLLRQLCPVWPRSLPGSGPALPLPTAVASIPRATRCLEKPAEASV